MEIFFVSRIQEQVKLENTGKIGHEEPVVSSSFGGRDVVGESFWALSLPTKLVISNRWYPFFTLP